VPAGLPACPRKRARAAAVHLRSPRSLLNFRCRHSWTHPEGWRTGLRNPATTVTSRREGANSREMCAGLRALRHTVTRRRLERRSLNGCESSGVQRVQDRVPLEALYVCEQCFGPLEVAYDHSQLERDSASCAVASRAATEHLALRGLPAAHRRSPRTSGRLASRVACRRMHAADPRRPARRASGPARGVVKNDAVNPTHSFKDRVVSVAVTRARELGFEVIACASTGNLANSVAAHGRRWTRVLRL